MALMHRPPLWSLTVTAMIIGVLGYFLWREHGEVTMLRAKMTKAEADRGQVALLRQELAASRKMSDPGNRLSSDTGAVKSEPAIGARTLSESDRQLRGRMLQYQRWRRLSKNADVIAALQLPPERLARFKDLLVERAYAETDARDAASQVGLDPNSSASTDVAGDAMGKVDERIKALLGETDFQKYSEMIGTDLVWGGVRDLIVGYFVDAGAALTAEQTSSLGRIFYQNQLDQMRGWNGQPEEPDAGTGLKRSQTLILNQAAQALSIEQLATLRNFFLNDNQLGGWMKASPSREPSR